MKFNLPYIMCHIALVASDFQYRFINKLFPWMKSRIFHESSTHYICLIMIVVSLIGKKLKLKFARATEKINLCRKWVKWAHNLRLNQDKVLFFLAQQKGRWRECKINVTDTRSDIWYLIFCFLSWWKLILHSFASISNYATEIFIT